MESTRVKKITITQGYETIVDEENFKYLSDCKWCVCIKPNNKYAHRRIWDKETKKGKIQYLHHLVIGYPPPGFVVDHINQNGLDNRKENLRFVTKSINGLNCKKKKNSSQPYKGITYNKNGKFQAVFRINGIRYRSDGFDCPIKAHESYKTVTEKLIKGVENES